MSEGRGPYWTDATVTLEVLEPDAGGPREVALARPFGLVGRIAQADVALDDRDVSARHVYLHADGRGLFAVDLSTRTGTRFNEADAPCGWLRPGEAIEVAGRLVRLAALAIDGRPVNPPPCAVNPLADAGDAPLVSLTLEPAGQRGSTWVLGSEMAFIGRGDSCAIRLNQASVSRTHCVLLRTPRDAYVIDLPGQATLVNGQPPRGAVALRDGDVLSLGQVRFVARVAPALGFEPAPALPAPAGELARVVGLPAVAGPHGAPPADPGAFPLDLVPPESRDAVLGWMLGVLHAGHSEMLRRQDEMLRRQDDLHGSVALILQHLRDEAASRLETRGDQLDAIAAAVRRIEDRVSAPPEAPAAPGPRRPEPGRPARDVPPAPEIDPSRSFETAAWLLDRLDRMDSVENKSKFSWQSLLGRLSTRRPDDPPPDGPVDDPPPDAPSPQDRR